jgi:hypothetical protein
MELQDFLNKLEELTYTKYEDKILYTEEGFEIYYEIELMGGRLSNYPLQFIFRVRKDDTHVTSWGCGSNQENIEANCWWQSKVSDMHQIEYDKKEKKRKEFINQFNQLTL